jgi:hemerythrin-like metal-binding protein
MEQEKKFKWGKLYSVHNLAMDRQHKYLFGLVNQFNELRTHPIETITAQLPAFLTELYRFTEMHFSEEEKMLERLDLPDGCLGRHKEKHRVLLSRLSELAGDLSSHYTQESGAKTSDFLRHWLMDHILATDKRYGEKLEQMQMGENTVDIVCNETFSSIDELFQSAV